jgi:hypothetical protein
MQGETRKAFHYTIKAKAESIFATAILKRTAIGVHEPEKPILWFSTHPLLDPTAYKAINEAGVIRRVRFDQMVELGLFRFGVDRAHLLHWTRLWRAARMTRKTAEALAETGIEQGADPLQWFGSLVDIPLDETVSIEVYQNDEWKTLN